MRTGFFLFCIVGMLMGCAPSPTYQRSEGIPGGAWSSRIKPVFRFDIEDTVSAYKMNFIIRHTEAYPFSNIWLNYSIKGSGDSAAKQQRLEIPLASDKGEWYGRGMGEIWEQSMPITVGNVTFPKRGRYEVTFEHLMRTDPLPEVLNVGLRVEKMGVPRKAGK